MIDLTDLEESEGLTMLGIGCYVLQESYRERSAHVCIALVESVLNPDSIVHMCISDSSIERFVREGIVVDLIPVLSFEKSERTIAEEFLCILRTNREL